MAKKVLLLVGAVITPGGLVALVIAWVATRPDVQVRVKALWMRAVAWVRPPVATTSVVDLLDVLPSSAVRVPVSRSRCNSTVTFEALRAAA